MIFITVGTANKGFDRLIETCDRIAGKFEIDFFAQTGCSRYKPHNIPFREWLSRDEIKLKYELADAFVIHGGFGTLSEILSLQKPIIVVPRSFENGEAVNDQKDLSIKLDSLGYVKCITDLDLLENSIINMNQIKLNRYSSHSDIPAIINRLIGEFKVQINPK